MAKSVIKEHDGNRNSDQSAARPDAHATTRPAVPDSPVRPAVPDSPVRPALSDSPVRPVKRSASVALQRRIIERERRVLLRAFEQIEADGTAIQATALIVAARRKFVIGAGKSFAYASLLAGDLSAGLSQVTLVDGAIVRPLDILTDVRASDIVIAFSVHPYRSYTVDFSRQFRDAGGRVVAVTDKLDAPICPIADVSVVVPTENTLVDDSPTALVAAIHLLTSLATASAKGARRRLERRAQLTRALNIYSDQI